MINWSSGLQRGISEKRESDVQRNGDGRWFGEKLSWKRVFTRVQASLKLEERSIGMEQLTQEPVQCRAQELDVEHGTPHPLPPSRHLRMLGL